MPTGSPSASATQQPCRSWSMSASVRSTAGRRRGTGARKRIRRECAERPSNTACSGSVSPGASGRTTTRGSDSPGRFSTCRPGAPCAAVRVIIADLPRPADRQEPGCTEVAGGGFSGPSAGVRGRQARRKDGGRRASDPARMTSTATPRQLPVPAGAGDQWRAGARAAMPFVIGLAPFGVTVGAAVAASADPLAAWTGTLLLYGGSGQLAVLQVLGSGAPVWTAILVGVLVNARLLVYSGGLAPLWKGARPWATVLGAATVVEPTWAIAEHRRRTGPPAGARAHYAGAAGVLTVGWTAAVTLGTLVGQVGGLTRHLA